MQNIDVIERDKVCEALRLLRLSFPKFRSIQAFCDASGLAGGTVRQTERYEILPSLETMEKWTRTCGLRLSQFLAGLEENPQKRKKERTIPIAPEHRRKVELLLNILNCKNPEAIDGITSNLISYDRAWCKPRRKPR